MLYSALNSKSGASHLVFRLIIEEKLNLAISVQTYFEYYEVLTRPQSQRMLRLSKEEIEDVLDLLALLAKKHSIYYLMRPNLIDEDDNIFVECAFSSNSEYLITSNIKDFKSGELKGFPFQVLTPGECFKNWRE